MKRTHKCKVKDKKKNTQTYEPVLFESSPEFVIFLEFKEAKNENKSPIQFFYKHLL